MAASPGKLAARRHRPGALAEGEAASIAAQRLHQQLVQPLVALLAKGTDPQAQIALMLAPQRA